MSKIPSTKLSKRRSFELVNLMLRKALGNKVESNAGKQAATWEGTYKVMGVIPGVPYRLENLDG